MTDMATVFEASQLYDPDQDVLVVGVQLANRVIEALDKLPSSEILVVSFKGIRGAASSYFNVFLYRVGQYRGRGALTTRMRFDFDSTPQQQVFARSLKAVMDALDLQDSTRTKSAS